MWQQPALGDPLLPRPAHQPESNRSWSTEEFNLVWSHASSRLRRALALAHYGGLRIGDIVQVPWSAWDGEVLTVRQSRTGDVVHIRAPGPLRDELNTAKREGTQMVVNNSGQRTRVTACNRTCGGSSKGLRPSPWSSRGSVSMASGTLWAPLSSISAWTAMRAKRRWVIAATQRASCTSAAGIDGLPLTGLLLPWKITRRLSTRVRTRSELDLSTATNRHERSDRRFEPLKPLSQTIAIRLIDQTSFPHGSIMRPSGKLYGIESSSHVPTIESAASTPAFGAISLVIQKMSCLSVRPA